MREGRSVADIRDHLMFGEANLGDTGHEGQSRALAMSDQAEVCGCNGVCKGTIVKAIKDKGLFTLDDVRKHTKASSFCGSCTGLVEQLLMATAGGDYSAPAKQKPLCGCTERTHQDVRVAIRAQHLLSIPATMRALEWRTPNGCARLPACAQLLPRVHVAEGGGGRSAVALHQRACARQYPEGRHLLGHPPHVGERMVWIACTNPAQSLPDQATVRAGLARAELVVLQEAFAHTETAAYADVLLPAAAWGEKEGTVTNSERRISRMRAALPPVGEARADWEIAADFARRLERHLRPARPTLFPYATAGEVYAEHAASTRGRDLDITGLSHDVLDAQGPQQWPFPTGAARGRARLYEDGVFPTTDGRARFAAVRYVPVAEAVNAQHPFRLNTGRLRDQWHGMSRTGLAATLCAHAPEPAVELHPADLARRRGGLRGVARGGARARGRARLRERRADRP